MDNKPVLNRITRWVILDLERWWQNENNLKSEHKLHQQRKLKYTRCDRQTFLNKRI